MLLLTKGSIFLEGPVSLFPSVSALSKFLLRASCHVVYVAWTNVVIIYEFVSNSTITMFLDWIQVCTSIQYLKDIDHLVPDKISHSVNGPKASGSLPRASGPLRIDPQAIISSSCVKYSLLLARYVGSLAATGGIKSFLNT